MRERLMEVRRNAGYTQYSMAECLGISRSHYSQIESGAKTVSLPVQMRIRLALRYTGDDLLTVTPAKNHRGRPARKPKEAVTEG